MAKFEDFIAATGPPTLGTPGPGQMFGQFIDAMRQEQKQKQKVDAKMAQKVQEVIDRLMQPRKAIIFRGRRIEYDRHLDCYFSTDQQWRNRPWPRRYPVPRPAFVDDSKRVHYGHR